MSKWDFDKLFDKNNVVGLKNMTNGKTYVHTVSNKSVNWKDYMNDKLSECRFVPAQNGQVEFRIQYILKLDENGEVAERLFDRRRDMMPEIKDGTIVKGRFNEFGVAINNRIVYESGMCDTLSEENIDAIWDENIHSFIWLMCTDLFGRKNK